MKKYYQMTLAISFAALTLGAWADREHFNLSAWRGETVYSIVPSSCEFGAVPPEIAVRIGVLRSVKYAPTPDSLQRLEVLDRVDWSRSRGNARVVEVKVPETTPAGEYICGMMKVRVVDRILPPARDWKFYLNFWQHPWAVARMAHAKPFTKRHYAAMKPLWTMLADAGQKSLTVTLVDFPWNHQCHDAYRSMIGRVRKDDGSWAFDYSVFDQYVEFGRSCGIGPNIECFTMCPWGYVVYWKDEKGVEQSAEAKPGSPVFNDYWSDFLIDFAKHLKEKGWYNDAVIAMDERSPEDVTIIAKFIQERAPGLRISLAGNRKPSEFKGIKLDIYAQALRQQLIAPEFYAEAAERRNAGLVTGYYICCSPRHPNTFMWNGVGEAFWCGVGPAFLGLDGLLRWAYNSWPENPMVDASYNRWDSGDTFLIYPDGSPSWRFLEVRNGIVAAEKTRIMKAAGLYPDDFAALAKRFNVDEANKNKSDFRSIRKAVIELVNR